MPWLNELWFILIAVLFIGFFFLEGFDLGVGIVTPFLGKTDKERRVLINTIGPFWDANEVWLIHCGGRHVRRFPPLVRHAVQPILHGASSHAARLDRPGYRL